MRDAPGCITWTILEESFLGKPASALMYYLLMWCRRSALMPVVLLLLTSTAGAAEGCKLMVYGELPVTMEGLQPVVVAKMNGVDARFVVDSGAFYSMLSPATVVQFKLPRRFAPTGYYIEGVGGATIPEIATAQTFALGSYSVHDFAFLVAGNGIGGAAVGLIGQNVMRLTDVEFDFANGVLRLVRAQNCRGPLAYWAKSGSFGTVDIAAPTPRSPSPTGHVLVNGVDMRVEFDTGASTSVLALAAAKRAGITPSSPDVKAAGSMYGIGHNTVRAWIAPIASFKIDNEEIEHTKMLIGDIDLPDIDMLIGADFFLSHRVFVANDQRKLYFTYNGGPVFDLQGSRRPQAESKPDSSASSGPSSSPGPVGAAAAAEESTDFSDRPTDAAGFMRRGAAFAARRDFDRAIADLKRACELAPGNPDYYYELGRVQWQSGHADLALTAFDRALELKPVHVAALFARTQLRMQRHDDVAKDLDALDRLLPPEDGLRLELGSMYDNNLQFAAAVRQFDLWIGARGADVALSRALNNRCWARAEADQDLDRALADCDAALRLSPNDHGILDSRGLVQLRRAALDRSIADYDAALATAPKSATSLYGRGLAKLRRGLQVQGKADLDAASTIDSGIAARFAGFGLKP
jgi:tetratricopeptide (TPR) repeat protein